jgi:hypothetical protein
MSHDDSFEMDRMQEYFYPKSVIAIWLHTVKDRG